MTMRALVAYAIIGFVNIILCQIIFTSSYLIIPYPRAVVVAIQLVPAWIVKLTFPHIVTRLPYRAWPLIFASCWILSTVVTKACPPNVTSLLRILMTLLAAATAAGTDVSCLSRLPFYGPSALTGWGFGTACGLLASSVAPYVWTVHYGHALRDALEYTYHLVGILLLAFYAIMPSPTDSVSSSKRQDSKNDDSHDMEASLLAQDPSRHVMTLSRQIRHNFTVMRAIKIPYAILLRAVIASQYFIIPGIGRAFAVSSSHESFESFYAATGLAFHLGNILGRSSIGIFRFKGVERFGTYINVVLPLMCLTLISGIASSSVILYPLLSITGVLSGLIYINIWADARNYLAKERKDDLQFGLGVLGAAEVSGMLAGALAGCFIEWKLCDGSSMFGTRWCTDPSF